VIAELVLAALVGLVVGSFLGTLVLRVPKRMPVAMARSVCPACGHRLTPVELIPLVSWLVQRRKCRACGNRIPFFYPAMEVASAIVAILVVALVPWPASVPVCLAGWAALVMGAWLVPQSWFQL
jgi:prepilin signal peptidase PulO-like enzyme (type II secretory pathway)